MEKVRAGETIEIKASTWNAFIDAANFAKERRQNNRAGGISSGLSAGVVRMRNDEGELRPRFSALVLDDVAVPPSVNEDEFLSCAPVFIGRKMTEAREGRPFAVLLEPIGPKEVGRAMVLGIVPATVSILDAEDGYAVPTPNSSAGALRSSTTGVARIIWKAGGAGEQWCLLQLGGAGGGSGGDKAYMCLVTGGNAGAGYQVAVYPNGRNDTATESAVLYVPELALGSEVPTGTWIIGHRAAMRATGGNDT